MIASVKKLKKVHAYLYALSGAGKGGILEAYQECRTEFDSDH
jgi:hypothetical protein